MTSNAAKSRRDIARSGLRGEVESVTRQVLERVREQDYAGWDPYDGLNSPIIGAIGRNPLLRLIGMHLVNRSPINLRPLLRVPKKRNPMGVALFARTYLYLYELSGDQQYLSEAEKLLDWLRVDRAPGYEDAAWGYPFAWQNGGKFYLQAYDPCIVVSVICGEAFLHHWRITSVERSLQTAWEVGQFITSTINTVDVDGREVYSYTTDDTFVVINANALAANYLAQVDAGRSTPVFRRKASEVMAFVVDQQTDYGAWFYSVPPNDSHLKHDNFHTGYVVESLRAYMNVTDSGPTYRSAYEQGVAFYKHYLFTSNGAPKFDHTSRYPQDIHGAAQGIRTFVYDGQTDLITEAETIIEWCFQHMLDPAGYFYRRRGRVFDDTTPYIRWNQAWMTFALASFLYYTAPTERTHSIAP